MRVTVVYYKSLTLISIKSHAKQNPHIKSQSSDRKIILEPVRKTPLDFLLLIITIVFIALAGFNYYKNIVTRSAIIALPAVIFLLFLIIPKYLQVSYLPVLVAAAMFRLIIELYAHGTWAH